ncbi:methyl-accepting chemotaxis protein [Pannonibacter phragmitetus]|uniref:methyl-accepting chemotaxis protein n=1 Tax=Pannonibacter phragmitetus TaxID=121719 RepID=UPI003D2F3C5A
MDQLIADTERAPALSDIVERTSEVRELTTTKVGQIRDVTGRLRMLALNAMIESARAGDQGRGFLVVAQEVREISTAVEGISGALAKELAGEIEALETLTRQMALQAQGSRLTDLALNAIELIDRNLYERTCDVRWWATDSAVAGCAEKPAPEAVAYACERLGVILGAYTVYMDLWLCDLNGRVIANGRPDRYRVIGSDISSRGWFSKGKGLRSGDDYVADEITREPLLGNAQTATYLASVREGGRSNGRPLGMLAIHFDWEPQAKAIVEGVRLTPQERERSRVMLVSGNGRVLASSDGKGVLSEQIQLQTGGRDLGFYVDRDGATVAFHKTPGYETYAGLGWYGVIRQRP